MSLFSDIIGELFVQLLWDKVVKPIFFFTGFGLRVLFNFKKESHLSIRNKQSNSKVGFFFVLLILLSYIVFKYI